MTEYINKDFYKQIPANERHFIKLSQEAAYAAVKELEVANIPHSATISEYRSIVTVNKADSERAEKIAENSAKAFPNVRTVLGNTEFKYIRDKKYIDTDADTARQIADILSGNANNRFSGIIRGDKATITVSGEKNAAAVRAMIDNLKNMDLLEALRQRGFERIADTNGFVNIRSVQTGEVCGFNSMAAVRDMLDNTENEFFNPPQYRISYREHPTNDDYYYCILKYNSADKSAAKVYRDGDNKPPIFKSIDEALSYINANSIEITNIDEEIVNWREVDREREDNSIIEENRKLIENFPISGGNYVDLVSYNPNTDTFSWVYYNPDGDNGSGVFVDKTITKGDIFAAYSERISAENREQGRNAFIAYLNEHCKENVIELYSGYFYDYANDYINYASRNYAYYFGISENSKATMAVDDFINHFEINCNDVNRDKQQRELAQKISSTGFRVELDGYSGAWNVIDNAEIDGRELFMLENDYYGNSVAYIVADKDGNVIDDNVWGDFSEYEYTLEKRKLLKAAENGEGGTTMPVLQEFAEEMQNYGFDVSENNGVFTVNKEDIASYVRMDTIADIFYEISEMYRFEPNEVGNNHLLDLNRFYDSYEWDGYSLGKNVFENTIIALKSGNFEPVENYVEQVKSVCENSSDLMQYEKSKIAEVEEHLGKIKAAFVAKSKTEIEVPIGDLSDRNISPDISQDSNIHFGYFGNGVLCYDVSKIDKETDDYLSAAYISNEGNIRYYVDDLSESDKQAIENHANGIKKEFTAYWNGLSLQEKFNRLYDRLLSSGTVEQIKAFDADRSVADVDEKVRKYEHSLIFMDEEFPFNNAPAVTFEEALNDLILEKNREAVEKIEVGGEITLNGEVYAIKNIDGDFSLSMEKKGDSGAEIKRYVGNWKEQLLNEAGDNALFVYSAILANDINVINALNAEKSKENVSADNSEIISNDTYKSDNTVNFLTDNILDLDNETAERLVNAFSNAASSGWESGDNQAKTNRIKKALYNILSDEDKTEKAFALISKNVYNHNSDTLDFKFGSAGDRDWFTESELLHNFVKSNRNISFALANAVMGYLDEKQHTEREIDELNAGWYDKTNFTIKANIDGDIFDYDGRFDIGDGIGTGGGTIIDHIRTFNESIIVSDKYPYNTKEAKENAKNYLDVFVPFLEKYSTLSPEEEKILAEFKESNPIRTSAYKDKLHTQTNNDNFEIYQVKRGDEYFFKRFIDLSTLGGSPDMSDYDLVYSGKLSEINVNAENKDDILENIYTKFNNDRPDDFTGHSLSVSDIVVLHTDGTDTAHYVDDIGFKEVLEFLTEKTREQEYPREQSENSAQPVLSAGSAYIYSEIKFETGEVYLVPDVITDDNIAETAAYKEVLERYADRENIENLDEMLRVNILHYRYGSGIDTIPNNEEMEYIRNNSEDILNYSEIVGNTEFFSHFWKNVDDILNELDNRAAEQHRTSPKIGDGYEEKTYIFPSDYSSDYPDNYSAVSQIKISGEWLDTEEAVKNMNAQDNTDTAQIEALRVRTVSFDGIERNEEMSPEAFHIILERTNNNRDKLKEAAELNSKGDIMPFYTKTSAEAAEAGEREIYFADRRENEKCASSIDYSISCNNDGMHFNSDNAISDLLKTYSLDRIALIIAAMVADAGEWDRRFSTENVEWAKDILKGYPVEQAETVSRLGLKSHSVLLDAAASELRKNYVLFRDMQAETEKKAEIDEQQSFIDNIKNLSQLKRTLTAGTEFVITDHARKECIGERRRVTEANTACFYSQKIDENGNAEGKPLYMEWGKAKNWNFDKGICSSSLDNKEKIMSFRIFEGGTLNIENSDIIKGLENLEIDGGKILDVGNFNNSLLDNNTERQSPMGTKNNEKSAEDITVGDKFLFNGTEVTVTSLKGIYPDEIGVSKLEKSGSLQYEVTSNVSKYDLARDGVYIGNSQENDKTENTVSYTDMPTTKTEEISPANYEPRINDVIENEDGVYRISEISGSFVTLLEADTLLPEEKILSISDFYKESYSLIERGEIIPEETETAESISDNAEISMPKAENFAIKNDNFGDMGGAKSRYAANIEAIKILKSIESEQRTATPAEQEILAGYTGWGAIPQAFDSTNDKWSSEYGELKEILTTEEYEAARHSTMNAHYTSPTVISAMYNVLDNLGFEKGNILEPAMGTGNFFGMLPKNYEDSKLYGVELDSITGRIAQQLYPNANIQIKGYEKTAFPDNSFDVAIGNVPFGDYKVNDKRYNDSNFNIHDYFFAKTLDKVHAGGIIAFVTSKGTMDKENDEIRKYIAERAELLGAIRLPNNAFKATAGTEVTSDILILQKRERPIEINPDSIEWLKKSETADGLSVNNYFVQHPEMVLGKIVEGNKLYGHNLKDTSCIPIEGADLKQQLAEAVKNIKGTYKAAEKQIEPQNAEIIPAPENSRTFSFYALNGNIYYRKDEDTMEKVNISKDVFDRAMAMIALRDNVHELLNLQLENSGGSLDGKVAASRELLNKRYNDFVKKYGNISDVKNARAFKDDSGYNLLSALEIKDEQGKVTGKADIFTKNTLKPKIIAEHVETAEEALILSVSEKGKVDFDFMTDLCGMDKERLISELDGRIYKLPQETEKYVTADEYLSGNIRKKMKDIENCRDPKAYEKNYEALQAAMPPRVEAKDISVKLGSHWVDPKYIRQFILEKFQPDARTNEELNVSYSNVAGVWKIEGQTATAKKNHTATSTYGTNRKNAYEIIEGILNNSDLQVKDRKKDEFGYEIKDQNDKYILIPNEMETKAVRHCANVIKSEFVDWIFKDPERREALVQKYNEVYNSFRYREYDGSNLNFVGMNSEITLKEHQKNAIARGLFGGNTLLAHAVGAGKTFEMIGIAMEGKRLGLHNKSLFAVPNALTEQMGNDFRKLYPNANILVATKKDFEKKNRARLLAKMATNDWDAVIVGHSQFDRMGLSAERESQYLNSEINKLRNELERIKAAETSNKKSFTVKQIEKTITNYTKRLESLKDAQAKDDFIDFEQLGFDKMFVDECHMYKNLATATKMRNVSGLGSRGSARAFNLLMKCKYLDEKTDGKGTVFASGTPVSNSMTELYTLMRYLQADTLKDLDLNHFDEWAADFGEVVTDYELKPESDGKYQLKTRFAKFQNLPELMSIFKQAADIRTADTLDIEKPKAIVKEIMAKPSKYQKRAIKYLGERAAEIRLGGVDPRIDNMLCVTNDGRKIGLDARLFNPYLTDDPNSKVNMCVKNVLDIYAETSDKRSTQCIFCDMSTPKTESRQDRFAVYRPNEEKDIGYEIIRKKNGIKKETDFTAIKDYIKKNSDEEADKLRDGDIAVIRRPNADNTKIISEAAVYEHGKFNMSHSDELLEKLEMSPIEDMPPKEFNIYDDIKSKLVAQGVPEKEIAFIHDYDTPEEKQSLFNKMNAGDVRILLGSTQKCGAGMNAQKKMIALHHLDAPMRPSDMEQRNGRIERQGNENPEVQIYRYVTDRTFDAYLYQMLENKQRFISQVFTSKTPERVCSDIDETALDYAEVKALCAGNPLIKEEMELQNKIKDLKMEKSRFSENLYDMQDKIRVKYPEEIRLSELINKHSQIDLDTANAAEFTVNDEGKKIYPIEVNGKTYTDRKEGGNAIKTALGANIGRIAEGKTVEIGTYRGMKLSVYQNSMTKKIGACLEGYKNHYCELNPETDSGNIIRLDNCINNIEVGIKKTADEITSKKADLEQMKIDVEKPFPKAEELFKAETRLEEVHIELTQFELNDDSQEKDLYERLCDNFLEIMSGQETAMQLEAADKIIKAELKGELFTLTQSGDSEELQTVLRVDYENEKVIPFSLDGMELSADIEEKNSYFIKMDKWLDGFEDTDFTIKERDNRTECNNISI